MRDERFSYEELLELRELAKTDAVGAVTLSRLFAEIDFQSDMIENHWLNLVKMNREKIQMRSSGIQLLVRIQDLENKLFKTEVTAWVVESVLVIIVCILIISLVV